MNNPRQSNGNLRRKNRARIKARGEPCYLCGRPIDYSRNDTADPYSWVIDEVIPVSRWREFGYLSPRAVAEDFSNRSGGWVVKFTPPADRDHFVDDP